MKIRTIMTAAATGILLTAAGSSLAWVPAGPVPEDMLAVRTINTAGATNTETAKAAGLRTGIGYARTETMDRRPHQALQGMDAMAETALMADAAAVHITDRKTVLHLAVPDIWSGYAAGVRCRRP